MLIVDGSRRKRSAIGGAAAADGMAQVAGEATDREGAVWLARALVPDVALLRLKLPDERTGVLLCRELRDLAEPPLVVLHDDLEEQSRQYLAYLLSGADGFAPCVGECDPDEGSP